MSPRSCRALEAIEEAFRWQGEGKLIVTDSVEQARLECGDLVAALEQGVVTWDAVYELGEVVAGKWPGRQRQDDVTLFESQGVAMEDVAVAVRLVARGERHLLTPSTRAG